MNPAGSTQPVEPHRQLGQSGLWVTPVALGLWPIAGMTTLDVHPADSLATIDAAIGEGINFFDTAYCYGTDGISERMLGTALAGRRGHCVVATKCGIHWAEDGSRVNDASPERLKLEAETSLRRLQMDSVDLMYLHSADGRTPVAESAGALLELKTRGLTRAVGISNLSPDDLVAFHSVCPVSVVQYRYNLLQREIETAIIPWCLREQVAVVAYWPLMKGLLAGKIRRDWRFDPRDKRLQYPMFNPPEWEWNQALLDRLDSIARDSECSLPELVVGWTIQRPGITAALCGARRPGQIAESAGALKRRPGPAALAEIELAVAARNARERDRHASR